MSADDRLLDVCHASIVYPGRHGRADVHAVNDVSLRIGPGEVVGLVGESGCGKSTLGNAIVGLLPLAAGTIRFMDTCVDPSNRAWMRSYRRKVQMIFQDPMGALNPRLTVGDALDETLYVHRAQPGLQSAAERYKRSRMLMEQVGMDDGSMRQRYPHELSGGQRQRIGIARALAVGPQLLVADEPVSALDVSVQVQILNLLKDISATLGVACLFIAHDLAVVRYMCKRTYVMLGGGIVEEGLSDELFSHPAHPYTAKLIAAVPDVSRGLAARKASVRAESHVC